jgi:hypothetical protein
MNSTLKKCFIVLAGLLVFGMAIHAQTPSARYEITAPPEAAQAYSAEMEQRFDAYNAVFRFDPDVLASPFRVRIFTDKNEYDSYVESRLGRTQEGAVYLHYSDREKRELVIHRGSDEEKNALNHQAFIQFIRAFVPNPPEWIRDGFAAYFSALTFDEATKTLVFKENLSWLETAKRDALQPEAILLAGVAGGVDGAADSADGTPGAAGAVDDADDGAGGLSAVSRTASSWALVSFFMADTNSGYYRALTDSFMLLDPAAGAGDNAAAIHKRIVLFNSVEGLTNDYNEFLAGKTTFAELVEEGQKQYRAKNYAAAGDFFRAASDRKSNDYIPWYYLGLIAYAEKKFSEAEAFYKTALDGTAGQNAAAATVQYARGVNAAAEGKKAEAAAFLREAAALDSARFKAKCDELLGKLE